MIAKINSAKDKLIRGEELTRDEFKLLIDERTEQITEELRAFAEAKRREVYGTDVYIRGLIEISNICKNDCLYCGIRASNTKCERYRLTPDQIIDCCREGYGIGFRTFVLQGGEDPYYTDEMLVSLIESIKQECPEAALTLSLGERPYESYAALRRAGADRYLLRHESASKAHYEKLHPERMEYGNRMRCLHDLKELGYQVGAGFMVGSPYQTSSELAEDLYFIQSFKPDMCGIGPFLPAKNTPFEGFDGGSVELTLFLLSVIRLIHPSVLLPATTALGTASDDGREKGILAGANVVMPNLSPMDNRKKYELYNNKLYSKAESAQAKEELEERMKNIGYEVVCHRGDAK